MRILPTIALLALGLSVWAGDAVKPADLPATVKTAMDKATHGAELTSIEKSTGADGKVVYVGKYTSKKGKEATVTVGEDGKIAEGEGKKKKH